MFISKADLQSWCTDRKCFPYSDGTQDVHGDPMEIMERMNSFAGGDCGTLRNAAFPDPEPMFKLTSSAEGEKQEPVLNSDGSQKYQFIEAPLEDKEKFYAMIRFGFEVQPWDRVKKTGCTWSQLRQLWNNFNSWLDEKKEPPVSSQTSSAPTEEASLPV